MTASERDELLVEIQGDVKLLLSYVIGNGTPGLVNRTNIVEKQLATMRGAASVMSIGLGVLLGGAGFIVGQYFLIIRALGIGG